MSGEIRNRLLRALAVVAGLFVVVGGGAYALGGRGSDAGTRQVSGPARLTTSTTARLTTTAPAMLTTTTTAAPETTTTTATPVTQPQPDESVRAMQQRLADLGYDIGPIDGLVGARTYYTIQAFQKVEGLSRDGIAGQQVQEALAKASKPGPLVPGGAANRVEVDLDRQVLFLYQGGQLARILPISTGNGVAYCENGLCGDALTPTGSFRIGRKASGLEVSPLGQLWSPSYFYGGIAFHGSPAIPPYPASHGCVRIPMYAHESFFDQTPSGMMVYVVGNGPAAADVPPPPDAPITVDPDPPAPPPVEDIPTTTTTVPPATTTTTTAGSVITAPSSSTSIP